MPAEQLQRLGEFSPHQLFEAFLGYYPPFQVYTGLGALAAGLLLLFGRTALLGALLAAADLGMRAIQDLCYPGPASLAATLLLLLAALFLVAPHLRRMLDVLVLGRSAEPAPPDPVFGDPARQRRLDLGVVALGLLLFTGCAVYDVQRYRRLQTPRSSLYGAWTIERWSVAGADVALDAEPRRWRRMAFAEPGSVLLEDGLAVRRSLPFDEATGVLVLGGSPPGRLAFRQVEPNRLVVEGNVAGQPVRAELSRMMLYAERFHWVFRPEEDDQ